MIKSRSEAKGARARLIELMKFFLPMPCKRNVNLLQCMGFSTDILNRNLPKLKIAV